MKKIAMASLICAGAFAASDNQIIDFYKGVVSDGVNVSIAERKAITDGIEAFIVRLSNGANSQNEVIFAKGDLLFPDIINLKEHKSYLAEIKQQILSSGISSIYKKEDKANIISLGSDSKKPTIVMFSDPECPYCRAELDKIELTLKEANVNIILTPVHEKSSLQKSFLIYKDVAKLTSDSEKIKTLRKYFADNYKVDDGLVSDSDVEKIENLRRKYFSAGVRSVPRILNLSDLQK